MHWTILRPLLTISCNLSRFVSILINGNSSIASNKTVCKAVGRAWWPTCHFVGIHERAHQKKITILLIDVLRQNIIRGTIPLSKEIQNSREIDSTFCNIKHAYTTYYSQLYRYTEQVVTY